MLFFVGSSCGLKRPKTITAKQVLIMANEGVAFQLGHRVGSFCCLMHLLESRHL